LTKKAMLGIAFSGLIMGLVAYAAFLFSFFINPDGASHYEKAITVTFVSIIFGQYANLLSRQTQGNALGRYLFSNRNPFLTFGFSISYILLIVYVPICNLYFHTSALKVFDWILPLAAGAI